MQNPLAIFSDRLGLSPDFLAAKSGLTRDQVDAAIADDPADPLAPFLKLAVLIGAKMYVRSKNVPVSIWVENAAVDALLTNNQWRRQVGLCRFPRNTRQLGEVIRILLDEDRGARYVANYLQANFIPNRSGGSTWTEKMIEHHVAAAAAAAATSKPEGDRPAKLDRDAFRSDFRRHVASVLSTRAFSEDYRAALRYELTPDFGESRVTIRSGKPVPDCVARWMNESIGALRWFPRHAWGFDQASGASPPP